jgi:hypothetical protein
MKSSINIQTGLLDVQELNPSGRAKIDEEDTTAVSHYSAVYDWIGVVQ